MKEWITKTFYYQFVLLRLFTLKNKKVIGLKLINSYKNKPKCKTVLTKTLTETI